jgi:hypothetical protein
VTEDQRKAAEELRESLEEIRDALLAENPLEAARLLGPMREAFYACRTAYTGQAPPKPAAPPADGA